MAPPRPMYRMLPIAVLAIAFNDVPHGAVCFAQSKTAPTVAQATEYLEKRGAKFRTEFNEPPPYALDLSPIRDLTKEDLVWLKPLVKLRKLYLNHPTQIACDDLAPVADLVNLIEINLPGMKVSGGMLKHVSQLPKLSFLNLGASDIADADLVYLKDLKSLRFLTLYNTKITGPGLDNLSGLINLEFLTLAGLKIDDAHLEPLAALKNLKILDIVGTQISDASIDVFEQMPNLRRVDSDRSRISAAGRKRIEEMTRGRK